MEVSSSQESVSLLLQSFPFNHEPEFYINEEGNLVPGPSISNTNVGLTSCGNKEKSQDNHISTDTKETGTQENVDEISRENFTGQSLDDEYDLEAAERAARESGTLTPLVKHELKLKIQSRRLSQGKGELKVKFSSPKTHKVGHSLCRC